MRTDNVEECLKKVKRAIELYERAKASPNSITVTQLARKIASPRSHKSSAKAGIKTHNVWGDPLQACNSEEYWTPLPLACQLEGVWTHGIADLVRFQRGAPIEVVELKHYEEPDKYAEAQVLIYVWLTAKIFDATPKAFIVTGWEGKTYHSKLEINYTLIEVERIIRKSIRKLKK